MIVKFLRGAGTGGANFDTTKVIVAELLGTFALAGGAECGDGERHFGQQLLRRSDRHDGHRRCFCSGRYFGRCVESRRGHRRGGDEADPGEIPLGLSRHRPSRGVLAAKVFKATSDELLRGSVCLVSGLTVSVTGSPLPEHEADDGHDDARDSDANSQIIKVGSIRGAADKDRFIHIGRVVPDLHGGISDAALTSTT